MTTPAPPPGNRMPTGDELRERLRPLADAGRSMIRPDSDAAREALLADARDRTERARRHPWNRLVHWVHLQRHREQHRQSCTCRGGIA